MKLALLGYGKMGRMVELAGLHTGHTITCKINRNLQDWSLLDEAEIAIDFSHADVVLSHVKYCAERKKNVVIGTTGWLSDLDLVKEVASKHQIGVLFSPNFSLGAHLFLKLLAHSGHLFNPLSEYQAAGIEIHHNQKKDTPSGTALAMREALKRPEELPLTSIRLGSVTGKHTLIFDSPFDTISISHEAKNKEGFANGAIKAAEWLIGKRGFYTLDDML